jgi:transposase
LAPYNSDLNPIEQAFAKLKALLKAKELCKLDDLWKALGTLLDQFSPKDCKSYFANAGYLQSA